MQWRKPFIRLTNSETQMSSIGRVESVWRYPVKSMCDEQMPEIFASFAGSHGDRPLCLQELSRASRAPLLLGAGSA